MMDGWHHDMGAGTWIFMAVFWIAFLALVVWVLAVLLPARGRQSEPLERPQEILDRRLAAGEIDVKTYDKLRAKLRESVEKKT
jgi:putative membrane protein